MGGTTGTATIVVTDLVGSTPLRSALGEHAADDLRREHDAALTAVVTAHRGRVVKGAGDGILAAFESASDAAAAAVAMQREVSELARRRRLRLTARIGISAGDVSWEEGDCFGLPVVEAARLQSAAEPGRILCAGIVRALARGRAGVEFGPESALALPGLAEPVAACEISWSPPETPGSEALPLVGRAAEMERVIAAWQRATAGSGGAALVAGEPGIGKTRLVAEVASRVAGSGGIVWWGTAYEGEGRSYGPITEMVDSYVGVADPVAVAGQLGSGAGLVARLAPMVREVAEAPDPFMLSAEAEQERTVDALVDFVAAVASRSPLLVVVDDAHWADASTVGLLRTLLRRAARLAVLVIVAYRDTDLDRRHPLADALAEWRRQPSVLRVGLRGLDRDQVGELVAAAADDADVPAAVVSAISAETDGNPLFVREVVLHLLEEGRAGRGGSPWVLESGRELGIPEGVRDAIGRRLTRLSTDTNRLLAVAAAFDAGFGLGDVGAVAGLDEDAALDAIDEALRAQMVRPGDGFDRYQFSHALIRHTLWAELNPSRQVRVHRAIAEQIEKRTGHDPTPDEAIALARHFHYSAALAGAERGVTYALAAADHAASRFAPTEEYQAVAIALELLPADDDRVGELDERAARAASLAAEWARGIDHARAAIDRSALTAGPVAACGLAVDLGRVAERVETNAGWPFGHLAQAYRDSLHPTGETAVQLLAWDVAEAEYLDPDNPGIAVDSPERQHMNELAARLPPSQRPQGPGGYHYPSTAAMLDDYNAGKAEHRAPAAQAHPALHWWVAFTTGRYRQAIDFLRTSIDELRDGGYVRQALTEMGMLGRLLLVLGELDQAAGIQAESEQLLERVEPDSNVAADFEVASAIRAWLVDLDFARVLDLPERLHFDRTDLRWVSGPARLFHASSLAAMGEHRQALDELFANIAVVERAFLGALNYPVSVHYAAQTLWSVGRADHVDVLERNLHTKVLQPDFNFVESDGRWTAALLCALTQRYDEAHGWFQQAHDRLTAQEAVLLLPHVCYDEALMEMRRGPTRDRDLALRRLDEASRWVDHIGLPNHVPRIDELRGQLTR